MVELVEVHDVDDPRLADFRDLTVADRRPDRPGGRGLVIAEGVVVVRRLLASRYPPRAVFGVRSKVAELADDLAEAADTGAEGAGGAAGLPCYVGSADLMARVVGFHLNRGVLATADRAPVPAVPDLLAAAHHVAVLEGINDHENLGSLFRNAAALGVDAVLLGPRCADPLYRRSVRVSMGNVLRVPFATLRWPDDLAVLRCAGFRLLALTPATDALPLWPSGLESAGLGSAGLGSAGLGAGPGGDRVAWMLGAEGPGLSDEALAAADVAVRIPMTSGVDSLNVATAAAIAFATVRNA